MSTPAGTAYGDQLRRRIADAIRRHACWVTYVADDGLCDECRALGANRAQRRADARAARRRLSAPTPAAFAYTTGLYGVGHPELLAFGLPMERSRRLLTELAHGVLHRRDLTPGELVATECVPQTTLLVEALPNPGEILFVANEFYRRPSYASVEALQLSWPDGRGRYPGEPGCTGPAAQQPRPGTFRA